MIVKLQLEENYEVHELLEGGGEDQRRRVTKDELKNFSERIITTSTYKQSLCLVYPKR